MAYVSTPNIQNARGRLAYWARFGDPVKEAEARQDLAAAMLERTISKAVLRQEQRDRLALLLMAGDIA